MIEELLERDKAQVSGGERLFVLFGGRWQVGAYELAWRVLHVSSIVGYCIYTLLRIPCSTSLADMVDGDDAPKEPDTVKNQKMEQQQKDVG